MRTFTPGIRAPEIAALERMIRDLVLPQPLGGAVVLVGPAGIGKTTLVDMACDLATATGIRWRVGRCSEWDEHLPYAAISEAVGADVLDATGRHDVGPESLSDPAARRWHAVSRASADLEAAMADGPLMLVVEDVHWADTDSLVALGRLTRLCDELPLLILLTARPTEAEDPVQMLLRSTLRGDHDRRRRIDVRPLSAADATAVAACELGAPPDADLTAVLANAGGNPLYIIELIRALREEGRLTEAGGRATVIGVGLPPSLRLTMMRRLGYLPTATLDLLKVTAVLGEAVPLSRLATVSGRPVADVTRQLQPAYTAGLLNPDREAVTFHHTLIREVLLEEVPAVLRCAIHREAAAAVAADGGAPSILAMHLFLGLEDGRVADAEALIELCRALLVSAPALALRYVDRALEVLPSGHPARLPARVVFADALARTGEPKRALQLAVDLGRTGLDSTARLDLHATLLATTLLSGGAEAHALESYEELVRAADVATHVRARHLGPIGYAHILTGDVEGFARAAALSQEVLSTSRDDVSTAWGLLTAALSAPTVPIKRRFGREAVEHVRTAGLLETWCGITASAVFADVHADDLAAMDEVDDVLDVAFAAATQAGLVHALPMLHYISAKRHAHRADFIAATASAESVLGYDADLGYGELAGNTRGLLATIALARGRDEEAERLSKDLPPMLAVIHRAGLVARRMAQGRQADALELAVPVIAAMDAAPLNLVLPWLTPVLEALASGGAHATVDAWVAHLRAAREAQPDDEILAATTAMAVLLQIAEDRTAEHAEAAEAAVLAARAVMPVPWRADALRVAAAVVDDDERAIAWLKEARTIAVDGGSDAVVARLDMMLRRRGVHRGRSAAAERPLTGWDALTEAETRVATLVAEGHTYREIGEMLFVSRRTVETHVANVFAKVGVRRRADLALAWGEHQQT